MPVPARPWAWLNADDPMISPVILLLVFVVCTVAGYFIIKHVPSLLHTPLMSGMNALSGVTIVGALAATAVASPRRPRQRAGWPWCWPPSTCSAASA